MYPTVGRVADSDQSAVQEPGTCLAIDGRTVGDPVACVGPHAVETVGIVDLSGEVPRPVPAGRRPGRVPAAGVQPGRQRPTRAATDVIAKKKLTVYWDNVTEESWNAGTRKINCNLAALLPDRSGFAPVTGSVTGDVVVGGERRAAGAVVSRLRRRRPAPAPPRRPRRPRTTRPSPRSRPTPSSRRTSPPPRPRTRAPRRPTRRRPASRPGRPCRRRCRRCPTSATWCPECPSGPAATDRRCS